MSNTKIYLSMMISTLSLSPALSTAAPNLQWRSGINQCQGRWGYKKYANCTHEDHGIKQWKLARHKNCGPESYNWGEHPELGTEIYREGFILNGIPILRLVATATENAGEFKLIGTKMNGESFEAKTVQTGHWIDMKGRTLDDSMKGIPIDSKLTRLGYVGQRLIITHFFAQDPLHTAEEWQRYLEKNHPGLLTRGRNEAFGPERFKRGPHPDFGVAEYKECRTAANGVESYVAARSKNCNDGKPEGTIYLTKSLSSTNRNPILNPYVQEIFDESELKHELHWLIKQHGPLSPGTHEHLLTRIPAQGAVEPRKMRYYHEIEPSSLFCTTGDDLPAETTEQIQAKFKFLKSRYQSVPSSDPLVESIDGQLSLKDGTFYGPITNQERHEIIAILKELFYQKSDDLTDQQIEWITELERDHPEARCSS